MRRVHILFAFLLVLATTKKQNDLRTVDITKLFTPEEIIKQVSNNVQKRVIQMLPKLAAGISPENTLENEIKTIFADACSSYKKANEAVKEIEAGQGPAYQILIKMIEDVIVNKVGVIGQMVKLGLVVFLYKVDNQLWDEKLLNQGVASAEHDKELAEEAYLSRTRFPQGYEASMKFLDLIGPTNLPYLNYRDNVGDTNWFYRLESEGIFDQYVTTASIAVFNELPKEKLGEFADAIKELDESAIKSYVENTNNVEPAIEPPTPEPVVEPPSPELEAEPSNPDSESEDFVEMIDEIVEEVEEENAKKEVTDAIRNIIYGEPSSDEDIELVEETGLADLSKDELEEVIEKIEETVADDDEVDEEAQCGESTDEVEDALTDSLVEKVKDELNDATEETIDDIISGDEELDDLEEDIADELELKDKNNDDLQADLNDIEKGEGEISEDIHKIIEEILPEEIKEIADNKDEDNETPIEDLIESVIEDIPEEVVDIIEEVPKEDITEVIEDVVDKSTEDLEDKHEDELEKEAEEKTGEPYECSCDCDRK